MNYTCTHPCLIYKTNIALGNIKFCSLNQFRCAGVADWLTMASGAIVAILHGFVLPISLLLLAFMTNAFVYHAGSRLIVQQNVTIGRREAISFAFRGGHIPGSATAPVCSAETLNRISTRQLDPSDEFINIDVKALTGGIVNCSANYIIPVIPTMISVQFNITQVLRFCTTEGAYCVDDASFTAEMNIYIIAFACIALLAIVFGSVQNFLFQVAADRQIHCMRLRFFRALLHQDISWLDSLDEDHCSRLSRRALLSIQHIISTIGCLRSIHFEFHPFCIIIVTLTRFTRASAATWLYWFSGSAPLSRGCLSASISSGSSRWCSCASSHWWSFQLPYLTGWAESQRIINERKHYYA